MYFIYDFIRALQFDGVNDNLDATSAGFTFGTTWTVGLWFRAETGFSGGEAFIGRSGSDDITIEFVNGLTGDMRYENTGTAVDFAIPSFSLDEWHNAVWVKTADTTMRCYFDGVESTDGEQTVDGSGWAWTKIGRRGNASDLFHGTMDDIILYNNTIWTATNVLDWYNLGCGTDPTSVVANANRWYKLNEDGTDSDAIDSGDDGVNIPLQNFVAEPWVEHIGCPSQNLIQLNQTIHRANSY